MEKELINSIERIAKFQSGAEAWSKLNKWIEEHCPNAQDCESMIKILTNRIEELEKELSINQ